MARTYTKLFYHLVFSTKNRETWITASIEADLHKYIAGIIRHIDGTSLEINGMPDHVHILTILPPKLALSDVLRTIKANSSKWIHDTDVKFAAFNWQDGYSAFTVSKSQVDSVQQYIRDQKSHHRDRGYKAELIGLLQKHDIDYDEQYLWD